MMSWLDVHFVSILDGFAIGALLFILSVGLSLIFGLLDVLNLAHGTLFLLGSYLAFQVSSLAFGFAIGVVVSLVAGIALGAGLAFAIRPLGRRGHLDQAVLTLGIALIGANVYSMVWGDDVYSVPAPALLRGSVLVLGHVYPTYRLAVIAIGAVTAVVVYLVFQRTPLGALVRAAVADRDMVEALGVNTRRLLIGVFMAGAALACLGGVIGSPIFGPRPGLDNDVLLLALIVVVIAGLGSVGGIIVGAFVVGQVQSLGVAELPQYASFLLFVVMALVLVVRPSGLFGRIDVRAR